MPTKTDVHNLEQLLDRIQQAADNNDPVSLKDILEIIGRRAFGPLLLLAGLLTLAPLIGDIPGVPTLLGTFVFIVAVQILLGRDSFWLPQWMLKRSAKRDKLNKALDWLRTPAEYIDGWLHPRLPQFVNGTATYFTAAICLLVALVMPAMEFIPFSANAAGIVLTAFGLALTARDGLVALIAFFLTATTIGLAIIYFV